VRQLRRHLGWSARELGERCAATGLATFDRDAVASLETGRRQDVTVDQLVALAAALHTSPLALLVEPQESPGRAFADRLDDIARAWSTHGDVLDPFMAALDACEDAGVSTQTLVGLVEANPVLRQLERRGAPRFPRKET
jgi:transcriptional regulator with XRE-family HTH domain